MLIDLHCQGLVHFPGEENAPPDQSLQPLFAFLIRNPVFFCLADDNYALRSISAHARGERSSGVQLIKRTRHRVEQELSQALGHDDLDAPVPKEPHPSEGGDPDRHARNLLLRALIREGMVKGKLER
jgi:hypothetical protein